MSLKIVVRFLQYLSILLVLRPYLLCIYYNKSKRLLIYLFPYQVFTVWFVNYDCSQASVEYCLLLLKMWRTLSPTRFQWTSIGISLHPHLQAKLREENSLSNPLILLLLSGLPIKLQRGQITKIQAKSFNIYCDMNKEWRIEVWHFSQNQLVKSPEHLFRWGGS